MAYNDVVTGRKSAIGTSGVPIMDSDSIAENAIIIAAYSSNPANVYVGPSGLTTDSADATDGFPLEPGDSITIPIRHPNQVYVRAVSGTTNKVWWALV